VITRHSIGILSQGYRCATAEIIAWPVRCERRKASREKPNNRGSHGQSDGNRTTKHDHDIEKQTLS
jgi:hypothetical protein